MYLKYIIEIKNKDMSTKKTIYKYLDSLKELNIILKHTKNINMDSFCSTNKLSKAFPLSLRDQGIIKKIDNAVYEWVSNNDINLEMAIDVMEGISNRKSRK